MERTFARRAAVESLLYPLIVLLVGFGLATWLTPVLIPLFDDAAKVPNVFDLNEQAGVAQVREAGFRQVRSVPTCSSSVEFGFIREVVVDNDADPDDETSLVNAHSNDPSAPQIEISKGTPLLVKVGDGTVCS